MELKIGKNTVQMLFILKRYHLFVDCNFESAYANKKNKKVTVTIASLNYVFASFCEVGWHVFGRA
jgi:hypothetical protein